MRLRLIVDASTLSLSSKINIAWCKRSTKYFSRLCLVYVISAVDCNGYDKIINDRKINARFDNLRSQLIKINRQHAARCLLSNNVLNIIDSRRLLSMDVLILVLKKYIVFWCYQLYNYFKFNYFHLIYVYSLVIIITFRNVCM